MWTCLSLTCQRKAVSQLDGLKVMFKWVSLCDIWKEEYLEEEGDQWAGEKEAEPVTGMHVYDNVTEPHYFVFLPKNLMKNILIKACSQSICLLTVL